MAQDSKALLTDHETWTHLLDRVRHLIGDAEAMGAALHTGGEAGARARVLHRALAMLWAAHDELESTARRRTGRIAPIDLRLES